MKSYVILLHGIFIPDLQLFLLEQRLKKQGYYTFNLGYNSTKQTISESADQVILKILDLELEEDAILNFVVFSMGGLVLRKIFEQHSFRQKSGKIVMISTPNHGSPVANFASKFSIVNKLYGAALQELHLQEELPADTVFFPDYEVGIISGVKNKLNYLNGLFDHDNDSKVCVESSKLPEMKDHCILEFSHSFGPLKKSVAEQTIHFLQNSCFKVD